MLLKKYRNKFIRTYMNFYVEILLFFAYDSFTRRPGGRVVMQRTANPWMPVRFRPWPPNLK